MTVFLCRRNAEKGIQWMIVKVVFILAAVVLSCADAQQTTSKIGIVSIQGAIAGTREGQKAAQELDQKVVPKQKEFASRQSEIAQLQDQYNKSGSVMAEDKRNQIARNIDEKKKRLERDMQDAEEELRNEQQKMLGDLGTRLMAVIDKYGADHGYTVILDDSSPSTPLLFASPAADITKEIIALFDKTSQNGGDPPKSAPTTNTSTKPPGAAE